MICVLLVVIGFQCWSFVREALRYDQVDFGVYRHGGVAMLHGADLYALRVGTLRLPFTYPPAAALLFAPFAWLAQRPEQVVWAVCSILALWYVIQLSLRRYAPPRLGHGALVGLGVFVLVAHSNPVVVGMELGQINILLALLVLADFCGVARHASARVADRDRGGPQADARIPDRVPARRPPLPRAAVATATCVIVSFVASAFAPTASLHYWFRGYFAGRAPHG